MWRIKIKKVGKILAWVGGGVVTVFFLAWAEFFVWNYFGEVRITREVERALAERESAEVMSGETPRETFSLFLDALRDNDFDRAVSYFVPELREGWRIHLERIATAGLLDAMITDLENTEEDSPLSKEHFREINNQWHLVSL